MAPILNTDPGHKKTTVCLQSSPISGDGSTKIRIESRPQSESQEHRKFSWEEERRADCIWIYDEVFLYPHGRYFHKYKVKGDGTIFGDRITTKIKVYDEIGYVFASWEISHGLDPGDVREETHQARSDKMAAHWGDIAFVAREGTCN